MILGAVILVGIVGFMVIENLTLADAFYFSIVTLATVGYGDIHPLTLPGKLLAVFIIVMGVGTFLGVVANATELMLNKHEKKARLEKLNMIIGVFFSGVGIRLMTDFSKCDPEMEAIRNELIVTNDWSDGDFLRVGGILQNYGYAIEIKRIDLTHLRGFFLEQRDLLLRLLENPSLLEHESFTELLLAVFHLAEELALRENIDTLPENDLAHLHGDMKRVYGFLVKEWLSYMRHLMKNYPYLFSLALRINPFDRDASPTVR